ncbi:MAG TPA: DUF302 domain-containing protein [Prolixibacteraceae bacterium]|nr:DUF302 domain-containing protein [Prolixibacteraceae bacterium]
MSFYLSKKIYGITFHEAEEKVVQALKDQGFGVITEIDVQATLKNKIGADFRPYKILGACNPHFAHKVLSEVDKMGVMLPCNVCLQQSDENEIEIFTVNPSEAMPREGSPAMEEIAGEVQKRLLSVLDAL